MKNKTGSRKAETICSMELSLAYIFSKVDWNPINRKYKAINGQEKIRL